MAASPTSPLDHHVLPWLLAVALATAGPHAAHLPIWLSVLFVTALLWRAWIWRRRVLLPPRWLLALLILGTTSGIGWQFRSLFGKDAGVAMLVVFMALKPLETRSRRDALMIIMLGFFLLLTHYFYSQSIPTGLWLLAACTLLTATLIRLHGGGPSIPETLRHAGLLMLQALPFMLILYLLFPRVSGPLWGLPQDAYSGLSGLSHEMAPGSISNLIQSGAIAFRSQFAGEVPEKAELYWRGPVFDEYDGMTWRARKRPPGEPPGQPVIEASGPGHAYTTILEPHNERWLLALDLPMRLPADSALAPTFEVLAREPVRVRSRFSFVSSVDYHANRAETPETLRESLAVPADINPRARALANTWRGQSTAAVAETVLHMFREQDFRYTLRPPLLGAHPVDEFLFETRRGFCEHYASAFVFLMRAAGVPARVVAGYQGGEINPIDGYLIVRQSDAHAWAEIWVANEGWTRVDPTAAVAPSRIEQGITAALPAGEPLPGIIRLDAGWLRGLRHRWEATNNAWNQWVLGYNPQRQREVLSRIGVPDPDWRQMAALLAALCALTLLLVAVWARPPRRREDPVELAWRRYCSRLARLGLGRAEWEGPLDFAERVAREEPRLAAVTGEAARCYAELRYGRNGADQLARLRRCLRELPSYRRKTF
ncbi:DUF3488 and transglutaminase-like domain-containing protein [Accumulibacter sp.]|uniref:transglutaminase TgpA family protein n=1 Tax=Accumulibacter sp. TaxID=2053492 RepID=UPI0025D1DE3A|nr:DUF3488 and transglutaminase-like domain-containing protein [Accumulibacter sp.]MCM8596757.1 DUF3488 and transglutaminase-like domain-containing protein [Accumulibacter sp.]MCM8624709.1 DUF3488 and transglutaminase-like domain-containing protein [Accumulibacter sp.]MDS4050906.1 DUF3488 and transglutaminase-like domain-containing protein [Accumulibacter sp.]